MAKDRIIEPINDSFENIVASLFKAPVPSKRLPKAAKHCNLQEMFGLDIDCYVLNDEAETVVVSQKGIGIILGFEDYSNNIDTLFAYEPEFLKDLQSPITFKSDTETLKGYDASLLIDACILVMEENKESFSGRNNTQKPALQIIQKTAKTGINNFIYQLARIASD
ncbi:hypothetical protein [Limnobaculum parvum]|uniref:Uncharacterized protein n=1 Tax=Limnobaculum parvum TaxID=2172103 RepID=A0A2Y9TXW2_9GAMM|nr:hypothetical protein [Limnobaculum parvum]AWH88319.1 hypothetical protein HYN51_06965 [Limnobaculum parvum]